MKDFRVNRARKILIRPFLTCITGGLLCYGFIFSNPLFVLAAEPSPPSQVALISEDTSSTPLERLVEVKEELANIEKALESNLALNDQEKTLQNQKAHTLRALRGALQHYKAAREKLALSQQTLKKAKADSTSLYALETSPPYNLLTYDKFLDEIGLLEDQEFSLKASSANSERELSTIKARLKSTEENLRGLKEQIKNLSSKEETIPAEIRLEYEKQQLVQEQLKINQENEATELKFYSQEQEIVSLKKARISDILTIISENLRSTSADVVLYTENLRKRSEKLNTEIQKIASAKEKNLILLSQVRKDLAVASGDKEQTVAAAKVEKVQTWQDYFQSEAEQKETLQQYLAVEKNVWENRHGLLSNTSSDLTDLESLKKNNETTLKDIDRLLKRIQTNQMALQSRIGTIQKRLEDSSRPYAELTQDHLQKALEALQKKGWSSVIFMDSMSQTSLLLERLDSELKNAMGSFAITKQVTAIGKRTFKDFWNMEVWVVEGHQITLGKIIIALGLLIGGFIGIRLFSAWMSLRLQKRLETTPEAAGLIRRVTFYTLFFITILWVLKIVNIPLTAFAFLGGALALAIGFGAQNLFNNFISGFFLIVQKPVKVGDVVELNDGTVASVVEVGTRHTRLQDFDNVAILLPNSTLLENKIVNWSYENTRLRGKLSIGVAYGSDPKEVEHLLLQAAREHEKTLTNPLPFVIFDDFGDSALNFLLYFWIDLRYASAFLVKSDLRYRIVELFRENNIEIPFPQIDVHFPKPPAQPREEPKPKEEKPGGGSSEDDDEPRPLSSTGEGIIQDDVEPGER